MSMLLLRAGARRPSPQAEPSVCNRNHPIYNLRHRNEAILDIASAMQLEIADLPEFPPRHRIGIKNRGLILRPTSDGPLTRIIHEAT